MPVVLMLNVDPRCVLVLLKIDGPPTNGEASGSPVEPFPHGLLLAHMDSSATGLEAQI